MALKDQLQEKREEKQKEEEQRKAKLELDKKKQAAIKAGHVFTLDDIKAKFSKVEHEYFEEIDAIIPLRRLTDDEAGDVQDYGTAGATMSGDQGDQESMKIHVDVATATAGERMGRRFAVARAMSVEGRQYTEDDIAQIQNPGLISAIASRVFELSGMTEETQEVIKRASTDGEGGESSLAGNDGESSNGDGSTDVDASAVDVSDDSGS